MKSAMDSLAGCGRQRRKLPTAKPRKLLYSRTEARTILDVSDDIFRELVTSGIVPETRVPVGDGRHVVRFALVSLQEAVRRMTDDSNPKGGQ